MSHYRPPRLAARFNLDERMTYWSAKGRCNARAMGGAIEAPVAKLAHLGQTARRTATKRLAPQAPLPEPEPPSPEQLAERARRRREQLRLIVVILALAVFGEWLRRKIKRAMDDES